MFNYYDLDDILCENTKISSIFQHIVPGLGYLDGNNEPDIKEGANVDLPFWLAEMLVINNFIDIEFPSAFSAKVRNALKACPQNVDLRMFSTHYYLFGEKILNLLSDNELVNILIETFKSRICFIADHAHNPHGALEEGVEFLRNLEDSEKMFFRIGHDSTKDMRNWLEKSKIH
ncbi:hypothetical protein PNEG_01712 [Pneumocystis murina B123]|uniref:DNA replication complex GINS protein PSF3 n=1 Tax=Pneumocystis murina (strain B123) TaxID=1069680 RepID=M7PHL9_PNEMU|nr:hypothetical protein PNEG_01712 [Pneumocystis murina B123]EMR09954.1 hypothetical protein PNEG_01712 [Pneumocystis murina B123]